MLHIEPVTLHVHEINFHDVATTRAFHNHSTTCVYARCGAEPVCKSLASPPCRIMFYGGFPCHSVDLRFYETPCPEGSLIFEGSRQQKEHTNALHAVPYLFKITVYVIRNTPKYKYQVGSEQGWKHVLLKRNGFTAVY